MHEDSAFHDQTSRDEIHFCIRCQLNGDESTFLFSISINYFNNLSCDDCLHLNSIKETIESICAWLQIIDLMNPIFRKQQHYGIKLTIKLINGIYHLRFFDTFYLQSFAKSIFNDFCKIIKKIFIKIIKIRLKILKIMLRSPTTNV